MEKKILFISIAIFFCTLSAIRYPLCYANNVTLANTTITGQNTSAGTAKVQFDLSWENSWRNSINYDAVWVFVKYSTDSGSTWNHAYLSPTVSDHSVVSGYEVKVGLTNISGTNRGMGVFIQRLNNGSGTNSLTGVQLTWNWLANNLTAATTARVKVFAIEMVYVPTGVFYAGSGGTGSSEFTLTQISTADATSLGGYPTGQTTSGNASWPNGYNAFYIMKYKISQQGYVDFFNTLNVAQKTLRNITGNETVYGFLGKNSQGTSYRNTISWAGGSADASAGANPYVSCNYLCWADVAAFADWAGLRPFTELEYEKACRGPVYPVSDEYAWGSQNIAQVTAITNSGLTNEAASNVGANCVYGYAGSVAGPMRGGFAASASSTRQVSGASYWGVMELSGNLWERTVSIGNATGRNFTGLHGDGSIDATTGVANVTNWPDYTATGSGSRGGLWRYAASYARVSGRTDAAGTFVYRYNYYGGRCSRTSP